MPIDLPTSSGPPYRLHPQKIICLGLNYRAHITESAQIKRTVGQQESHQKSNRPPPIKDELPAEPILFCKTPNTLIGPDEPIIIPSYLSEYGFSRCRTDYEGELALIISRRAKRVKEQDGLDYVFGYTCFNDVSQRNFQKNDQSGWFRGKSLDTFGPIGPRIVLAKDIDDPQRLQIQTRLNGTPVQDGNTAQMIFSISHMIAFISKHFTLEEGDIISTGTPSGVGPLEPGDVVEIELEQIGTLRNPVELGT